MVIQTWLTITLQDSFKTKFTYNLSKVIFYSLQYVPPENGFPLGKKEEFFSKSDTLVDKSGNKAMDRFQYDKMLYFKS